MMVFLETHKQNMKKPTAWANSVAWIGSPQHFAQFPRFGAEECVLSSLEIYGNMIFCRIIWITEFDYDSTQECMYLYICIISVIRIYNYYIHIYIYIVCMYLKYYTCIYYTCIYYTCIYYTYVYLYIIYIIYIYIYLQL